MSIEDKIDEILGFKKDSGNDMRGRQAHLLIQRYKQANKEERETLSFLATILLIGIVTNDKSLTSKAKIKLK